MKRGLVVASILGLVFAVLLIWYMHSVRVRARRNAGYEVLLRQYQSDLHVGMTRTEVARYLDSHQVPYGPVFEGESGDAWSYDVRIGEEPGDGIACDKWYVYIKFNFTATKPIAGPEVAPVDSDTLREIKISKVGVCL